VYEDKIYEIILSPELTWEGLIRDIVKKEGLHPWNIDICLLADKFAEVISEVRQLDFRLSGKFILTAAILLKMKSQYLSNEELVRSDYYLADLAGAIDLEGVFNKKREGVPDGFELIPRLSFKRTRRITLDELVDALRRAMMVNARREKRWKERGKIAEYKDKFKKVNILNKIKKLYDRIVSFFKKLGRDEVTLSELNPSKERKDIIWTFIPLLYLANEGRVMIRQEEEFGEVYIGKPRKQEGAGGT